MIEDFRKTEFYNENLSNEEAIAVVDEVKEQLDGMHSSGFVENLQCLAEYIKCGDWSIKMLAVAALIYFLQPFDALPDYIPLIGWADDIIVVAVVVKQCSDLLSRMTTTTTNEEE